MSRMPDDRKIEYLCALKVVGTVIAANDLRTAAASSTSTEKCGYPSVVLLEPSSLLNLVDIVMKDTVRARAGHSPDLAQDCFFSLSTKNPDVCGNCTCISLTQSVLLTYEMRCKYMLYQMKLCCAKYLRLLAVLSI